MDGWVFAYGPGRFRQGKSCFTGTVVMSEHRMYLRDAVGDMAQTYIPLEKIYRVRSSWKGLRLFVMPSAVSIYTVVIEAPRRVLGPLLQDLVRVRVLKRRWFGWEWADPGFTIGSR